MKPFMRKPSKDSFPSISTNQHISADAGLQLQDSFSSATTSTSNSAKPSKLRVSGSERLVDCRTRWNNADGLYGKFGRIFHAAFVFVEPVFYCVEYL